MLIFQCTKESAKVGDLQFGWIDFSNDQRNKVMSVISLLSEPDAVDELGIGMVRDGFSNIFFPGTSTIQTRAKYFLLTSYLLVELEKQKGMTPDKLIKQLNHEELNMIEILKSEGEKGIIGENAGKKLKRKPSDIYWNGLRSYGIFTGGKISLHEYAKITCRLNHKKHEILAFGNMKDKTEDVVGDDQDAYLHDFSGGFWRLPNLSSNWKENLTIHLDFEEALFLKNRIIMSYPDTMLGEVLEKNVEEFCMCNSFNELEAIMHKFSEPIQYDFHLAKSFSDFILGAQLRYNAILSKGKDNDVIDDWKEWHEDMDKYCNIDLSEILVSRLEIKNFRLIKFLTECQNAMKSNYIDRLDEILIGRECQLKGNNRSKLYNASEFNYENWTGMGRLQYRFRNGQNIIKDIFEGIGDANA